MEGGSYQIHHPFVTFAVWGTVFMSWVMNLSGTYTKHMTVFHILIYIFTSKINYYSALYDIFTNASGDMG